MTERYAVYFAPGADSELGLFGQSILCRSATRKRETDARSTFADQSQWLRLTEKPAHYGFHATLKAPFELAHNQSLDSLTAAVTEFAKNQLPIELTSLYPRSLGGFMALTLENEFEPLSRFALNCVESLEPFRKALSDSDLQRRKSQSLSNRQEILLLKYGYPYVADEFHFHLTLSGKLSDHDKDYEAWAISEYSRLISETPVLDRLAIFKQVDRQSPFLQLVEFCLPV
jgi:2'-5' RNA ligase